MSHMPSIPNTFQQLFERLALTEAQQAEAKRQQRAVRDELAQRLALDPAHDTLLTGSFARGTTIRKLKDVDLFAVLDPDEHGGLLHRPPDEALGVLYEALDEAYPNKEAPTIQDHTVRVHFRNSETSFEVVPALSLGGGVFAIPQKRTGDWIESNPGAHAGITRAANERTSGAALVLIKLAKHHQRVVGDACPVTSFHLEMMICELIKQPPQDYATGLRDVFGWAAERVRRPFPDPARVGPDIDEQLTLADRNRAAEIFRAAADTAGRAIDMARRDLAGAHWLWRLLLGDVYPESGRKPQSAPAIAPVRAVDETGSRFG